MSMDVNISTGTAIPAAERLPRARADGHTVSLERGGRVRKRAELLLLWLLLAIGAVAMVGPFYWMFVTSLKIKQELLAYPPTWWPARLTWNNWRALDHLTICSNEVIDRRIAIRTGVADIVDPFHDDHVRDSWLREHVAVEARHRVDTRVAAERSIRLAQHTIAGDTDVHDCELTTLRGKASGQMVRPPVVRVWR